MSDIRINNPTNKTWYVATSTSLDKVVAWYCNGSTGECLTADETAWDGFTTYPTEVEWILALEDLDEAVPENYEYE